MGTATVTGRDELGRIIDVTLTTTGDVAPPGPETIASGGAVETSVYRSTSTLTHAQILALAPAGFHEIVPAPGAGKALDILRISLASHIVAPYTGFDASGYWAVYIDEGTVDIGLYLNENSELGVDAVSDMLGGDGYVSSGPGMGADSGTLTTQPYAVLDPGDVEDKAAYLTLNNSGGIGGGNAANTLTVTVLYALVDL
jgi:hypothetical protein